MGGQKISWAQWSFADKQEKSAALQPGACASRAWDLTSCSGTFLKAYIQMNAPTCGLTPEPVPEPESEPESEQESEPEPEPQPDPENEPATTTAAPVDQKRKAKKGKRSNGRKQGKSTKRGNREKAKKTRKSKGRSAKKTGKTATEQRRLGGEKQDALSGATWAATSVVHVQFAV